MPGRRLTSLTNNKRKLLDNAGYKSIKAYRKDFPFFNSDESAYKYLLGEYNDVIDMLDEQERLRKEEDKKREKAYHKEKRETAGKRMKGIYKYISNNKVIDKADLAKYQGKKGSYLREVRVYYDCRVKNDGGGWERPFRTYKAQLVGARTINLLEERSIDIYNEMVDVLENISPELNDNFQMKLGKIYSPSDKVPLSKIKMRNQSAFKLNGEPLPSCDMGEGRCVYDALIHLWKQPNSNMLKNANVEYLNSVFTSDENPNPERDGVDTEQLLQLARAEEFSLYAFDIHNKCIKRYTSKKSRQGKKPPLIYRLYNEHYYMICDKSVQASLIAKSREGENIRHNDIENDKAKFVKEDEKQYTNVIAETTTGNEFAYDYIFDSGSIPFPFTSKNINYDNGHINSMKIKDKQIFTKPVETDILDYLKKTDSHYKGQHYISILMQKWEEHYECKLSENELVSRMNPNVCDLLNAENVKNRVHIGAMTDINNVDEKIDAGEIVGADIIKAYSSILDNPLDDWLVYELTDEIEFYNGKLQTGLYFVKTDDLTILHKTNWYSNTIIEYALSEGIELEIIRQYVPKKQQNNRDYFSDFITYIQEDCGMKLTKNILNSITGMLGKTKQSSYKMSITTDINEVWNTIDENIDNIDNFILKEIERREGKVLYIYGIKNKKNIYTNNLPMYIQILDQSNIKLHQLSKQMGGQLLYRKTDAAIMYMGKNPIEYDKTKRENWGKQTIMDKDELKKYDYNKMANRDRYVSNPFENSDNFWNFNSKLTTSSQYKEIIEYAIEKGGLLICSRAGTGKSYVVQKAVEDKLIDDDKRTRLAFTNKARRNINGSTIHSAISINADTEKASSKMIQTYKGKKVIIVDEISMLSEKLWTQLVNLKRISGAVFILLGDYRQLPAVENKDHNYFDSSIVKFLTNNNRIELTQRQRYDKELWDFLEAYWEKGKVGENLLFVEREEIDPDAYNICYFNKTRIAVNELYMEHYKTDDALFIPHKIKDEDDKASKIYIYNGLPVMAIVNRTKTKEKKYVFDFLTEAEKEQLAKKDELIHKTIFCNSDTMKVVSYSSTFITMKLDVPDEDGNEMVDVLVEDFHKSFVCNYCSTTHKNQGATIDRNIQLWDWNMMNSDRRIAYTAISRARSIQQVKIVA